MDTALAYGYLTGFIMALTSAWGMAVALHWFGAIYFIVGGAVFAVPWIGVIFFRRLFGWQMALWAMPLLWPLWEWAFPHIEIFPPWLIMASTQPDMIWLLQFADLFGQWGVSFWLILLNVLLYRIAVDCKRDWGKMAGRLAVVFVVMLCLPAAYSLYRIAELARISHAASGGGDFRGRYPL